MNNSITNMRNRASVALRKLRNMNQKILQARGKFAQYTNDPYGGFTTLFCDLLDKAIIEHSIEQVCEALRALNPNDISLLVTQLIPNMRKLFSNSDSESEDDSTAHQNQQYTELAAVKFLR